MGPVGLRFRTEFRSRWRSWLGLAALVGLASGIVLAAVAGGRRTESAYERFLVSQRAADVAFPDDGETPPPPDLAAIEQLPQVADAVRGRLFYSLDNFAALAPASERLGTTIDRYRVLDGRLADPRRAEEAVVAFPAAERLGLRVGSTFPLVEPEHEAEAAAHGIENLTIRVVGIVAAPGEFPPQHAGSSTPIRLTPAFYRKYSGTDVLPERDSLVVRLKQGQKDVPAFLAEVERLAHGKLVLFLTQEQQTAPIQRSFRLQAIALWMLAGLFALTALLVFGQTLARQVFLESTELPTLRALGMTRGQLFGLAMARGAAVALPAAALAVAAALLLSPLTPIGVARPAEPDPGFAVDDAALGVGGLTTILLVLALTAVPAWRATRLAGSSHGTAEPAGRERPSKIAGALARAGLSPALVAGVRLALEPGRGRSAVPVRTTVAGLVLGVAAVTASLVFGASLSHLLQTPRLYGWNWDLEVTNYGSGPDLRPRAAALAVTPGIAAVSIGDSGIPINVGRLREIGIIAVDGPVTVPVLAGRAPTGPTEIALGTKTMRRARVELGDAVDVRFPGLRPRRMKVVGRVVLSAPAETRLGEGAAMTHSGLRRLTGMRRAGEIYANLEPGADRAAVLAALRPRFGEPFVVIAGEKPSDIVNFGRVQNLPLLLAGILALLGAGTLVHTLVSAVRRRRRELAILKTLGFVRRQVLAAVLWQATTLAAIAVVVGVPLGIALGRWSWALFADEVGIVREPAIPVWQIAVAAAATVLLANVLAAAPGTLASRTHPAPALRAE